VIGLVSTPSVISSCCVNGNQSKEMRVWSVMGILFDGEAKGIIILY